MNTLNKALLRSLSAITLLVTSLHCHAALIGYSVLGSSNGDQLYTIDLTNGDATAIGATGFGDIDALAFQPGTGVLFGVDDDTDQLVTIDTTTGAASAVGALGFSAFDGSLAFNANGELFWADEFSGLYAVNILTGQASLVSAILDITGMDSFGDQLYGVRDGSDTLISIDEDLGTFTQVGPLGVNFNDDAGLAFAANGTLYSLADGASGRLFTLDVTTGAATLVANINCAGGCSDFDSLAINRPLVSASAPAALSLLCLGYATMMLRRRQK